MHERPLNLSRGVSYVHELEKCIFVYLNLLNDTPQVHTCHTDILSDMATPRGRKYAMNTLKSKELDVYACVGRSRAARKQGKQAALHPASAMATRTSCCPPCLASSQDRAPSSPHASGRPRRALEPARVPYVPQSSLPWPAI